MHVLTGKLVGRELYFSRFFLAARWTRLGKQIVRAFRSIAQMAREKPTVDELARPFLQLWDWIDRVGGYPGKLFFLCIVIMTVVGVLTWFGNKR